jgi:hypothetical protein
MRISPQSRFVTRLALSTLLGLVCQAGWAKDLSYRFVEVNFVEGELFHADSTRVGIAGSADLGDLLFISGGYTAGDVELGLSIPDVEFFHLGGGVHGPIISAIDWVIAVEYGLAELSRDGFSEDVEGYIANLGIRGLLGDSFEYSLAVIQSDLSGPTNGFEAGAWLVTLSNIPSPSSSRTSVTVKQAFASVVATILATLLMSLQAWTTYSMVATGIN